MLLLAKAIFILICPIESSCFSGLLTVEVIRSLSTCIRGRINRDTLSYSGWKKVLQYKMKANIQLGETVLFGAPYTNVRRKKTTKSRGLVVCNTTFVLGTITNLYSPFLRVCRTSHVWRWWSRLLRKEGANLHCQKTQFFACSLAIFLEIWRCHYRPTPSRP